VDFLYRVGVRVPADGTGHVAAYNALVGIEEDAASGAGGDLMTLHSKRNAADYRWSDLRLERQEEALALVESAREIVAALEVCAQDDDRVELITDHFRSWVPQNGLRLGLSLV
jgi:hypothetical protein